MGACCDTDQHCCRSNANTLQYTDTGYLRLQMANGYTNQDNAQPAQPHPSHQLHVASCTHRRQQGEDGAHCTHGVAAHPQAERTAGVCQGMSSYARA